MSAAYSPTSVAYPTPRTRPPSAGTAETLVLVALVLQVIAAVVIIGLFLLLFGFAAFHTDRATWVFALVASIVGGLSLLFLYCAYEDLVPPDPARAVPRGSSPHAGDRDPLAVPGSAPRNPVLGRLPEAWGRDARRASAAGRVRLSVQLPARDGTDDPPARLQGVWPGLLRGTVPVLSELWSKVGHVASASHLHSGCSPNRAGRSRGTSGAGHVPLHQEAVDEGDELVGVAQVRNVADARERPERSVA